MADVISEFGIEWRVISNVSDNMHNVFRFTNNEIGEFVITKTAFDTLRNISDFDKYKIPLLVYEQSLCGNIYSIIEKDEIVQWDDFKYISIKVEAFLDRFPSDFIEMQQRSLINLYNQYPEYGQKINSFNECTFFARNKSELLFILKSMKRKGWIDVNIEKTLGGGLC